VGRSGHPDDVRGHIGIYVASDFGHRLNEYLCHLGALNTARRQSEYAGIHSQHSGQFQGTVLDFLIFRKNDPSLSPNLGEPFLIFCIGTEVVIVNFDLETGGA
jgi:hypothetical protein